MTLYVAGNWKMHASRDSVSQFVQELAGSWQTPEDVDALLFPPVGYLPQLLAELSGHLPGQVAVGGQCVHPAPQGAFTGEMSAPMLQDLGATWVLAGHSERRSLFGEGDAFVAEQVLAALESGLKPVLCVGETLTQRREGSAETVVAGQLEVVLNALADSGGLDGLAQGAVAYEPVWAIGTGETASPVQAQSMHRFVRAQLSQAKPALAQVPLWYGGSVNADNAAELFAQPDIDGALVGGASLKASSFWQIVHQAANSAGAA